MVKLDPILKAKWITALTDDSYHQGQSALRQLNDTYCCLGVLCDVYRKHTGNGQWFAPPSCGYFEFHFEGTRSGIELPSSLETTLGLYGEVVETLISMNDRDNADFPTIAAYIHEHL